MEELHWSFKRYVYALTHPTRYQVRYIGVTTNIKRRMQQHISLMYRNKRDGISMPVSDWIRSLKGVDPRVRILEECDSRTGREREAWWIAHYHAKGAKLLNEQKVPAASTPEVE